MTMALTPVEEKQLSKALLDAVRFRDLGRMKEFTGRLDRGQGLFEIYYKCRGPRGETTFDYADNEGKTNICNYFTEVVGLDVGKDSNEILGSLAILSLFWILFSTP